MGALGDGLLDRDGKIAGPPAYVDVSLYRESIELLRTLRPQRLATSHYGMLEGAEADAFLELSLRFTVDLGRAVLAQVSETPRTLPELFRAVNDSGFAFPEPLIFSSHVAAAIQTSAQ